MIHQNPSIMNKVIFTTAVFLCSFLRKSKFHIGFKVEIQNQNLDTTNCVFVVIKWSNLNV